MIKNFLWVLFHPNFWYSQGKINLVWDTQLNMLIDRVENGSSTIHYRFCTIIIHGREIWIENYPYASGKNYSTKNMPRRRTRERLEKCLDKKQVIDRRKDTPLIRNLPLLCVLYLLFWVCYGFFLAYI